MSTLWIDGKTGITYADQSLSNPTGYGIQVIRSTGITLLRMKATDCLLGGIRDFAGATISECLVRNNGKDGQPYNGDGILVQGQNSVVQKCVIENNGNHTEYEHGIYAASVARGYLLSENTLVNNAASGIKASGGGRVTRNIIRGSRRGIVFADDVDAEVVVTNNSVAALEHAIFVTANCDLSRYKSDFNVFARGSRFWYKGRSLTLTEWRKATGLDRNSTLL